MPIVDVVNPNADARAGAGQPGGHQRAASRASRCGSGLDAYPDLHFTGTRRADLAARRDVDAVAKVRTFVVLIDVEGSHPNLMPDLTASLDVVLAQTPAALVVPRDAVRHDGERAFVRVQRGSGFADRPVTLGAMNAPRSGDCLGPRRRATVVARNVVGEATAMSRRSAGPARARGTSPSSLVTLAVVAAGAFAAVRGSVVPDLPTAEVTKGRVRRHARDPRRHPAAQVDRAVVADAVGRAADRQAGEERLDGQGGRRRRRSSTARPAADDPGEAVRAEAGRRRDRAGARRRRGSPRSRTRPR